MKKMIKLNELVSLAMETEVGDDLPWDVVKITPEGAYGMMAAHVIDLMEQYSEEGRTGADREIVMMAVMTKLLVENFLLQTKIEKDNS
jgi:hypothetical protein